MDWFVAPSIGVDEFTVGVLLAGFGDHRVRAVDSDGGRAAFADHFGQMAGAAAEIEDAFAGLWIKHVDEIAGGVMNEPAGRVVVAAVPLVGRR